MLDKIPDFNAIAKKLIKDAQTIAEVEMINFIHSNFEKQGFQNGSLDHWTNRKGNIDLGRALLKQTGELQDKIDVSSSSSKRVVVTARAKHAQIHNEGGVLRIPVTPKMRKWFWFMYSRTRQANYKKMALTKKDFFTVNIPKRQFMGPSVTFDQIIDAKFRKMIESRFKAA